MLLRGQSRRSGRIHRSARQYKEKGADRIDRELHVRAAIGEILQVKGEKRDQARDHEEEEIILFHILEEILSKPWILHGKGLDLILQKIPTEQKGQHCPDACGKCAEHGS